MILTFMKYGPDVSGLLNCVEQINLLYILYTYLNQYPTYSFDKHKVQWSYCIKIKIYQVIHTKISISYDTLYINVHSI